jgi:hypothetical protein
MGSSELLQENGVGNGGNYGLLLPPLNSLRARTKDFTGLRDQVLPQWHCIRSKMSLIIFHSTQPSHGLLNTSPPLAALPQI